MGIDPGTKLGPYEILALIGAGNMGEVYRARDPKLGRELAIKVLPESFSNDRSRVDRFEREAKTLAALNHPNIVHVYSVEEAEGVHFITMELVRGKKLTDFIPKNGMPMGRFVDKALPLAEAIGAAHAQGIVHRDLKPDNVMIDEDGRVKVLDFGLAKPLQEQSLDSELPTVEKTEKGALLGTVAYMSPEQAEGKSIDWRSDVFSLGVMFYQMATGRRPFSGESATGVLSSILRDDPSPPREVNQAVPSRIDRAIRRMLVKERSRRYQNLFDLRNDLEDFKRDTEQVRLDETVEAKMGAGRGASWFLGLVALASAVTLMALTYLWFGRGAEPRIVRMSRMIHSQGLSEWPTWSPDGNLIAFASNREGNFEIYVRQVDGGQDVNVTNHPDEDIQPALSPDGQWLAFISLRSSRTGMIRIADTFSSEFRSYGGDLWLMPVLGGQARRLAEDANYPAWQPSGEALAYVSGPEGHRSILRVAVDGGTPEPILPADTSEWEIVRLQYSPNGEWITFETFDDRLNVISAHGGEVTELLHASSHVWAPSGDRILFLSTETSGSIRVQDIAFDTGRGTTEGTARTLGLLTGLFTDLSVSADGKQLALTEIVSSLNLTRLSLDSEGKQSSGIEEMLNAGQVVDHFPVVSPDGSYIAYQSNRLGRQDIWLLELESRRQERLELPGEDIGVSQPYWSPDGEVLSVIRLHEDGTRSLWLVAVDGSLAEEVVPPTAFLTHGEFSPDGRRLAVIARQEEFLRQINIVDLDTRELRQLTSSQSDKFDAVWSVDGQSIVSVVSAGMGMQVVRVTPDGEEKVLASSVERLLHLDISPDGRWIYVQPSHRNIHRIPAGGGELEPVTFFPPSGLYIDEASLSPEGEYLVYTRLNSSSAIWVMEVGSGVKS